MDLCLVPGKPNLFLLTHSLKVMEEPLVVFRVTRTVPVLHNTPSCVLLGRRFPPAQFLEGMPFVSEMADAVFRLFSANAMVLDEGPAPQV